MDWGEGEGGLSLRLGGGAQPEERGLEDPDGEGMKVNGLITIAGSYDIRRPLPGPSS